MAGLWARTVKRGVQYQIVGKLGKNDDLIELKLSPQAKRKWGDAPESMHARLVSKEVNGKTVQVLTSMLDPLRYPKADIAELYGHRWEIEHGFREMKQHLLKNALTLRSKKPELVRQELWGVVLAYNLFFTSHLSGGFLLLHQSAYACMNPHDPNWIAKRL